MNDLKTELQQKLADQMKINCSALDKHIEALKEKAYSNASAVLVATGRSRGKFLWENHKAYYEYS